MTDYELGIERAASEAEWMKRGYAAWLMIYAQEAADAIRALPAKEQDATYREALKDATAVALKLRDKAKQVATIDLFAFVAERINDIPDDPLDEHHCSRKDGHLPSTSRGYKERIDARTSQ